VLLMDLISGMLLSLLAAQPLVVVLMPSITRRTEPAYRVDVPDILAVPHSAPHIGANRGNI